MNQPPSNRTLIGIAVASTGLAALVVGLADVHGGDAVGLLASLAAILLVLIVPWRAVNDARRALAVGLAAVAAVTVTLLVVGTLRGALGAAALLALGTLGLTAWTVAFRGRGGQPLVTSLALAWIALPYWGDVPLRILGDGLAMDLVLHSPLPILCGTLGDLDLLRGETLYRLLPLGQALPYAYPTLATAILTAAIPAALGAGAVFLRRRLRAGARLPRLGPAPAALAALLVLCGAPERAEAQLFPEVTNSSPDFEIGDLVTRVHLGYYVPRLRGYYKVDGNKGLPRSKGSNIGFQEDLNLTPIFLMPTFNVALRWANAGTIDLQYAEAKWEGATFLESRQRFEGKVIQRSDLLFTRYRFRSLALRGEIDIPIADWLRGYIITTNRYIKFETTMRTARVKQRFHDTLETVIPTVGVGVDLLVWNIISVYGEAQYLDFTSDLFGNSAASDERGYESQYHEYRVGVRLELVEHAHVSVEYYGLELKSKLGDAETYKQDLHGVRVRVAILF